MARTALTVQDIDRTDNGDPTFSAANADGHSIANDVANRTLVWVKNGGGSPITVTFVTNETRDGLAVADLAITVTNAEDRVIGPFPPTHYNQSDDTVHVDFSAVTTVTVAAFKLAST